MQQVANRVYRLGAELVNWFIIEDQGKLTLVDSGNPNQYKQLAPALVELGRSEANIEAIVLTHAHGDHIGSAARIKDETGTNVHVHRDEVALARGEMDREAERHWAKDLNHAQAWKSVAFFLLGGATSAQPVMDVVGFDDGEQLDVPGRPRMIHTPGHTDGSTCVHIPDRDVVFTGDSLVTLNIATGKRGAMVMPGSFNKDSALALTSLGQFSGIDARTVLPGHGEPWFDGIGDAVTEALRVGPS